MAVVNPCSRLPFPELAPLIFGPQVVAISFVIFPAAQLAYGVFWIFLAKYQSLD
jgi:hypothetical protein